MQVAVALDGQELKKRLGVPVVPRLVDNQLVTGAHFEAPQKKHAQPGVDGLHVHTPPAYRPAFKDGSERCIVFTSTKAESSIQYVEENYKNQRKESKRMPKEQLRHLPCPEDAPLC